MEKKSTKQQVTIEVDPNTATTVLGIVRGFIPSMIEAMNTADNESGLKLELGSQLGPQMKEVLDEIYERCIEKTSIRQGAASWLEAYEMTGELPDTLEN